jgi:cobalt transporter subunit CbtB
LPSHMLSRHRQPTLLGETTAMTIRALGQEHGRSDAGLRLVPALGAILLGLAILYIAGFAAADVLHNAAHDGRHAFAFPCH